MGTRALSERDKASKAVAVSLAAALAAATPAQANPIDDLLSRGSDNPVCYTQDRSFCASYLIEASEFL
jgi:hypothetical protein